MVRRLSSLDRAILLARTEPRGGAGSLKDLSERTGYSVQTLSMRGLRLRRMFWRACLGVMPLALGADLWGAETAWPWMLQVGDWITAFPLF